jgi:hypothetical protein
MEPVILAVVVIVAIVIGLPVLTNAILSYAKLKHEHEASANSEEQSEKAADIAELTEQYQEFVLGVDSRAKRLEDRIRAMESKIAQSESGENQSIRRA